MSYVTLAQLAEKPGATELAQVASNVHQALVDASLMEATLRETDRSAWSNEDIALADAALARIVEISNEVDETINAYIRRRVTLPVMPVPSVLTSIARAMVRYELHKDLIGADKEHPIIRDYTNKLRLLEAIQSGKVTLGVDDPLAASEQNVGDVRFDSDPPVFGRREGGVRW